MMMGTLTPSTLKDIYTLILHEVHFVMIFSFMRRSRTLVRRVEIKGNRAQKERARREKARAIPQCCLVTENYKCESLPFLL